MQNEKPYFFLVNDNYQCSYPSFFNIDDFGWVREIEKNWSVIKEEMLSGLNPSEIAIPNYNPNLVKEAKVWRNICFINYMWKKSTACKTFPKTYELINKIPNISYAALNVLEPDSEIFPHQGDTNVTARCHLGIQIPAGLPDCGMTVNGQSIAWTEGKIFAFSDAHWHSAWNKTKEYRFVFVIDIVLDQYANKKEWYCANVLSTLTVKAMAYKLPILHKMPFTLKLVVQKLLAVLWMGRIKFSS